jgi:ABC-type sugar transport system ATPase subunit
MRKQTTTESKTESTRTAIAALFSPVRERAPHAKKRRKYDTMESSMAEENIITISGLTKKFKDVTAVNDISLTVRKGTVFAFLGTNGAGKSTTINMLTTVLQPSAGTARVAGYELGKDDANIRQAIGVIFQQSLLDPLLTVRENLRLRATFYELKDTDKRIAELAKLIGLTDFLDRRYGKLSGGQRQLYHGKRETAIRAERQQSTACRPDRGAWLQQ